MVVIERVDDEVDGEDDEVELLGVVPFLDNLLMTSLVVCCLCRVVGVETVLPFHPSC